MKISLISLYPDIATIGLRILSASLKKEGHSVQIVFLRNEFEKKYENNIINELVGQIKETDLIGVSLTTNFFENAIQITQGIKKNLNVPIVWGGIHPTIRPKECLDYADMVCLGEGEETLVELVQKMEAGQDLYDIKGMWFKDKGRIITNTLRPLKEDLNSIAFPDYNYRNHYLHIKNDIKKIDLTILKIYLQKRYSTMASRGCPFGCTYCCNNTINQMYPNHRMIRKRNWDNIIEEINEARKLLPFIEYIYFEDDAFFFYTTDEIKDFCVRYNKYVGLPLSIGGGTPANLTAEKLKALNDVGLRFIRMGIQSWSERSRKLYKRNFSNAEILETIQLLNKFKDTVIPSYDIILDNPWETDQELIESLMILTKIPLPFVLTLFSLTFFPGTELYERAKIEGLIKNDLKDVYRKRYQIAGMRKTYLNKLFILFQKYVIRGNTISTRTMFLLTNEKFRRLYLSQFLYILLNIWLKVLQIRYYMFKGFKSVIRGDASTIIEFLNRKLRIYDFRI